MKSYAIVETGGKQYKVEQGDELDVESLSAEEGSKIELDRILAVSNGEKLNLGTPMLEDASVQAEVIGNKRGKKVVAFKKKRRKGYHRKVGHRQELTRLRITDINA